ncbi:MAG: ABC transporter ATP-binding protein [Casimicrobiaceae bacterium]|nr:ABC transporter ATP-binding protein [Casimicrobiaceae bacterium]MCX8099349.1 ABC transporter ATP-binding protein [Casimicrobiaceae bacterium]MDW8311229.1 ABC transporter ATP-binding protein [Burkholderiales bacterium]
MSRLLEVRGLAVAYGGIRAVKGIDFDVEEGELVTLIGANGAGKSSTLRALSGLVKPAGGRVLFRGKDITGVASHALVGLGIALCPEGRGVFARLSVHENLLMGAFTRADREQVARDIEEVFALMPRLKERMNQLAGTLSGGEQQMLAIGRAMLARPRLLMLDEPSMGLAPLMVEKVFEIIRQIAQRGTTILLVEQNAQLALEHAHRGYVLESGEIILAADARTLLADPRVKAAYLGG